MIRIFFYVILVITMVSCSDNTSDPNSSLTNGFIPLAKGNYWIYDTYTVDIFNNIISNSLVNDSITVIDAGKNIFENDNSEQAKLLRFRDGKLLDTIYLKIKDNCVYSNGLFIDSLLREQACKWKILDQSLPVNWNFAINDYTFTMNYAGYPLNCKLHQAYNAYDEPTRNLQIDNYNHTMYMYNYNKANIFRLEHYTESITKVIVIKWDTINGVPVQRKDTIEKTIIDTCNIKMIISKSSYWGYIKNVGIGYIKENPYSISSSKDKQTDTIPLLNYKVNGVESTLKRYKLYNK